MANAKIEPKPEQNLIKIHNMKSLGIGLHESCIFQGKQQFIEANAKDKSL